LLKKIFSVAIACLTTFQMAYSDEYQLAEPNYAESVQFIELDTADCAVSEGKLILIKNLDAQKTLQVWVDRWFMDVQTADHTKQVLLPKSEPMPLGCSIPRSGGKQYWTIYSIKTID
jgi:hypothetical protein